MPGAYTAPVRLTLLEDDTYLTVYDRTGQEFCQRTGGYAQPLDVEGFRGRYFFLSN